MNNDFGYNLSNLRKKKNLTQEQLANFLNISPAAVCKWEKGKSLPDLPMLILLSKYFHISIDKMVFNQKSLTDEEIDKICNECDKMIIKESGKQGLDYIDSVVKKYSYDKNLEIALVTTLQKNEVLIDDEELKNVYKEKQEAYLLDASLSEEKSVSSLAKYLLGCFYIRKKDYTKAEKYISEISQINFTNAEDLMLTIYMCKAEHTKAKELSKKIILSNINSINNIFLSLQSIYIKDNDKKSSKQILELHNNFINSLDVHSLLGNSLYQSQMLYAVKYQEKDLMLSAINNYIDLWFGKQRAESKYNILKMSNQLGNKENNVYNQKYKEIILKDFNQNPNYDFIRDDQRFVALLNKLTSQN